MNKIIAIIMLMLWIPLAFAENKSIAVQWLGHSAFLIKTLSGKQILIDPFLTKNPKTPEKYKHYEYYSGVNLILITHAHGDHVGDAIDLAKRYHIPVYAPPGLSDTFISLGLLPAELAPKFNKGGSVYPFGKAIKITMTHAEHSSEFRWKNPATGKYEIHVGGEPVGYILKMENGFTIYHMGDTGLFGDMALIGDYYKPDLVMIPIGGHYTMDPVDAAYALDKFLHPKFAIPMHYGTFPVLVGTVDELHQALKSNQIKVFDMVPGDTIKF